MRICPSAGLLLLSILLTACGSSRSAQNQTLEKLQSWIATVHFVSTAWSAGSVPKAYAMDTLRLAAEQIQQNGQQLRRAAFPAQLQAQLPGHVTRIETLIARLSAAVKRGDKNAAEEAEQQLASEQQFFRSLRSRARGSP